MGHGNRILAYAGAVENTRLSAPARPQRGVTTSKNNWQKPGNPDSGPIPLRVLSQLCHPKPQEKYIFSVFRAQTFLLEWLPAVFSHLVCFDSRGFSKITGKTRNLDIFIWTRPYHIPLEHCTRGIPENTPKGIPPLTARIAS